MYVCVWVCVGERERDKDKRECVFLYALLLQILAHPQYGSYTRFTNSEQQSSVVRLRWKRSLGRHTINAFTNTLIYIHNTNTYTYTYTYTLTPGHSNVYLNHNLLHICMYMYVYVSIQLQKKLKAIQRLHQRRENTYIHTYRCIHI